MRAAFIFVFTFISFTHQLHAQNLTVATEYLGHVGEQCKLISSDMMAYSSASSHNKSARKVEKKRLELMQTIKQAVTNMKKLKPFNGDPALRDSALAYFQITSALLNEDYAKIVDMEEIAEQSYDAMEAFMLAKEKAHERTDKAYLIFDKEFEAFAAKNNIRLIESSSKLSKKMEEASAVFKYYNRVYLIFFKSYKDEAYWMDALKKEDVNAMEQTKNALQASSTEGLKKMSPISTYNGDKTIKVACERMLEFYKYEATKSTELADFFLKKDNFEKSKKAMESKKQADRTQQDVDAFNKLVNEFNAAVGKFNQINTELNKKRNEALETWNNAADNFLDNHVPKHR
ncbi:MAG: hypothetical protein HYZ44_06495 [Bacteroidetes bacterium]|nr:hypothetical protein [Bacteroidota bacterium]